jgi:UDP-glucose 4-epimerase
MAKNCIIYGGGGFIGSHIADELLRHKFNVVVFDKLNSTKKNVKHILKKINFIEGDFNNKIHLSNSLKGKDYVIHLVSATLPADSNLNPVYDVENNIVSTLHLLNECLKYKIKKIVFISSGGTVYGNPKSIPIKEDHPTHPLNSYGITKLTIEHYLNLYKTLHGLDFIILRFSNPFGERQNPHLPQGLIINLLHKIHTKQQIEVWGDGSIVRDYFYIKDGVKSIYSTLTKSTKQRTFNISSNKGLSINQILDKFRKVLKLKFDVVYKPSRKFDVKVNILDNSLARKELNWIPQTNFDTALKNTWRYIRENY